MRIILKVTAGALAGQLFRFGGHDTFLVGRSKHTHLRLPTSDRTCSRIHFMIEVNPPYCRLMDMGSNNGTYVNDQRVTVADLKHGDKIRAGRNILRVAVQAAPVAVERAPAQGADLPLTPELVAGLPAAIPLSHVLSGDAAPPLGISVSIPLPVAPPAPVALPPEAPALSSLAGTLLPPAPVALPPTLPTAAIQPPEPAPAPTVQPVPQTVAEAAREPGLAGYVLKQKIGQGGMGVVHLAEGRDGALVALKMIRPAVDAGRAEIGRFLREAQILRQLQHPHIVACRDMGESDGYLYFAMDYVPGRDAAALVKEGGPLPAPRAVALTCQLLEALEYAHAQRFVHRDIKPSNLLIYEEHGRELLKLADFGLARVYQDSQLSGLTMDGDIGGTPCFMAPEQLLNFRDAPPSADQYAAAATLYYLLTGQYVYDMPRDVHRVFAKILNEDPVPIQKRRADVPAALAEVIHRALKRAPEHRYATAQLFRMALASVPLSR